MAVDTSQNNDTAPSPTTKRLRWATQRVKGSGGRTKRASILDRFHKGRSEKRESGGSVPASVLTSQMQEGTGGQEPDDSEGIESAPRQVHFNIPLPPDSIDEDGNPKVKYVRNKIRTAKYTALSFIPKNLWFQFHNLANDYFLFVIILAVS